MMQDHENNSVSTVTFTNIVPRTRNHFLQYSRQFTLDLNTVNELLRLSENNRIVPHTNTVQSYPDHPDRFEGVCQVLCRESVCGRCYWELEWSGCVCISVSYKSISRKGRRNEGVFGSNDQSWSLICSPSRYSFRHNKIKTDLSVESCRVFDDDDDDDDDDGGGIRRVGVFVDHGAGPSTAASLT
ncbi:stonustoxin subunit beta-like [Puntigrus tetrazona]|uniref:stonustoxin subunit beta-like n=1 Tax=Puntigrus tetrazona TaxID=1606681 RepID=UPI001C8A53E7|nr:stonustoxin subunit beta-like [Puntigrus tetrazona]